MSMLSTTVSSNAGQSVREITLGQAIRESGNFIGDLDDIARPLHGKARSFQIDR